MRSIEELIQLAKTHNFDEIKKIVSVEELIKVLNLGYFDDNHPQKTVNINGTCFTVDEQLYSLIIKMWNNGIYTKFSCQGNINTSGLFDASYITFDGIQSARKFFEMCHLAKTNVTIDLIRGDSMIDVKDINDVEIPNDYLLSIRFNPELINVFESILP